MEKENLFSKLKDTILGGEDTMSLMEDFNETENINDETEIASGFDVDTFKVEKTSMSTNKAVVKLFNPVSRNITTTIIDSLKKGEMCIINFEKLSDEEAKIVYSTLTGSVYTMEGNIKKIDSKILLCAPNNFIVDSTSSI